MNNTFTDEEILKLNEYGFNGNQIDRLEALALNLNLDLDDIYYDIQQIINGYLPQEPDFEVRISNEILIRLLERQENNYSFEDIQSLLEYDLIDEDFEWLLDNPYVLYEDIYHLLEDGWSFDEIKNEFENISEPNSSDDEGNSNDDPQVGGKRTRKSVKRRKHNKRITRKGVKKRKQSKTRRRKLNKRRRQSRRKKH
jgi:hypothetical protein